MEGPFMTTAGNNNEAPMKNVQPYSKPFGTTFPRSKPFLLLLLLVSEALFFAHCSLTVEKAEVAKIIQAYGGKETLTRVSSLAAEGKITTFMPKDGGTYSYYLKRNRHLLVDIKYTKRTEKRILNGNLGYSGTDEEAAEVTGSTYDAMVYQYNQLDLPYGLLDSAFRVTYLRKDSFHSRPVVVLKLTDRAGNEMEAAVDSENYHIVKTIGFFGMGREKAGLSTEFSDFRMVDGVLLPFTIVNYADGFKISKTKISKYTINLNISDAAFSP
jgi:hypothetical protein